MTIPRIDEPSPPGVSRTSTTAAYPSSSARSTEFSTYSCVTGLMSLSRWAARTRGGSAPSLVPSENTRHCQSAATASKRARNPRKHAAWHRCKDSISGGSRPLPANGANAPPWISVRRPLALILALLAAPAGRSERFRLELGARDDGRPPHRRRQRVRDGRRRAAVHARRGLVARSGSGRVPHALDRAAAGAPGDLRRPRPRTARTPDRRSSGARAGGSGIRGGSGRPTASRRACSGTSRESERSSSGAPSVRIPLRVPSCDGNAADRAAARRGARTSRSGAARRPTRRTCEFAIVHHTAGRNDYSRAEAAAIVRGIQLFHVQGERLERHRLQLSRRPLRDDLRGPVRRRRPQRRGRARARVQHRLRRNRAPRDVRRHQAVCRSAGRDRAAHRVAARSRARRSHLVPHFHLGRKRALRDRRSGAAARGVGSSRHGLHGVPREMRSTRGSARSPPRHERSAGPKIFEPKADAQRHARSAFARDSRSHSRGRVADDDARRRGGRTRGGYRHRRRLDVGVRRHACRRIHAGRSQPAPRVPRPAMLRAGGSTAPLAIDTAVAEPEAISPNGDGQADAATLTYRISTAANVTVEITDAIGGVDGDRGRPRVDAGRAAHGDDRRSTRSPTATTAWSSPLAGGRRVGSEARPAARQPHARAS